jgi:hypothetical protein
LKRWSEGGEEEEPESDEGLEDDESELEDPLEDEGGGGEGAGGGGESGTGTMNRSAAEPRVHNNVPPVIINASAMRGEKRRS